MKRLSLAIMFVICTLAMTYGNETNYYFFDYSYGNRNWPDQ